VAGQKAVWDSKATQEYAQLNAVVAGNQEGRRLGSGTSTVTIPFNFVETIAPILAIFVLLVLFFGVIHLLNKRFNNKGLAKIAELLKYNALIRFGLIFYLPL